MPLTHPLCSSSQVSKALALVLVSILWVFSAPGWVGATSGTEIGSAELQVAGTRLVVGPAQQTVPFDTATVVTTDLEGYDPELGVLPSDVRVQGDLVGPEISGSLLIEATPGEPLRIPRLSLEGEYRLENIRLVSGSTASASTLLAYAEPRDTTINVTQILITRVSSRALTLDEIRSRGLVIDDSFEAINLTFGYGVAGRTFDFNMPLVYDTLGPSVELVPNPDLARLPSFDQSQRTVKPRFKVPKVVPFMIEVEKPESVPIPDGGCDPREDCRPELKLIRPMVGVLLFPTEISLLHQFFSVVLQVENGAPEGDPAVLRDLFATINIPSGLKLGETEPPTLLGRPVPIKDPGPDGIRGTADDKNFLVAHASGDAEVLLEGVKHGTHIVEFDIHGVLEGLPTGPQPISGSAKGAIAVRDPRLTAHIAHPQVVRANVEYSVFITLANVGNTPVNLVSLTLPSHAMSGVILVGSPTQQIETLNPGESETVEFRVESQRTGKVVSSSLRTGSSVDPSFEWSVAVGDDGSLSPDSLVLPNTSETLPKEMSKQALALLGIGYSLAQAPPSFASGLPRVGEEVIAERMYRFGQLGRHLDYGEPTIDVISTLIADWLGARDGDWDWDQLRRESRNGGKLAVAIADLLDQETSSSLEAFRRFASTTHYLDPQAVLATDTLQLDVSSRVTGKGIAGAGDAEDRIRSLPFAELYDLLDSDLVVLGRPEDEGYRARLRAESAASGSLFLMVPDANGVLREIRFSNISLLAGGEAYVDFAGSDANFVLQLDQDGDGIFESSRSPFVDVVAPRPFQVLSAVQNVLVDEGGHVIDVLFSEEVDLQSMVPRSAGRFVLPDNKSNGGLVKTEEDLVLGFMGMPAEIIENPFEGLNNPRIVRVIFDNPVSPFLDNVLTVSDLENAEGQALGNQDVPVETRVDVPAIQLEGVIYGPDGQPMPGATVVLYERDLTGIEGHGAHCKEHPTAKTTSDENGRYHFGFVRNGACGPQFKVFAQHPEEGFFGKVRGKVRFAGSTQTLNLVMPGRGSVVGRVTYEDGSVPEELRVTVYNPQAKAGRWAHVAEDGFYDVDDMVVGTLTMAADDGRGNFAFGTFELPERGATVEKNLVIIRNDPTVEPPGRLKGTVKTVEGDPVFEAWVALYVEGERTAVLRTDLEGTFDFGMVPSGTAELEVFTESSTYPGLGAAAQVFFEIHPDRTESVDIVVRDDRGEVRGFVYQLGLDGSTQPVEGAVVWAMNTDYHTVTAADGSYSLQDVFAGSWQINAVIPEDGREVSEQVTLTTTTDVVDRDLYFPAQLPDGGLIGRVLDYDGEPVTSARVHLAGGYLSVRWHHTAITDSDGRFTIENLGPGTYGVHAVSGLDGGLAWAKVRFPGDTAQVTVRFQKGTIRGRTVAPVGEDGTIDGVISQIAYRKVEVVSNWDLVVLPPDYTYIETDPNGYFEIEGLVGPYELKVFNAFHGNHKASGSLDYHGHEVEHIFQFKENGDIRGVVYDHDGETPVAGARVSLHGGSFSDYDVLTDENGAYHFPLIPSGSYDIRVFHEEGVVYRRAETTVTVRYKGEQVDDVEITLPIQGSLTGWVTDADGYPVPGAVVTMQESGYPWRKRIQNADEEGNYAFENVFGGGPVILYAKAPSLGGLKARTSAEVFFEAQDVLTVLTLEPTGEVEGQVVMPDGTPVHLASVELSRNYSFEDATTTEEDGKFYFDKLRMGWYRVLVFDKGTGRKGRSAWVELQEHNQVVTADVELESRGIVTGRFTDGDTGSPLPGHVVKLTSRFLAYYATTDLDGYFDFGGIREGDFELRAADTDKRRWVRAEGTLQYENQEVVLDLELAPLSDVTGRVHNPPGAPVGLAEGVNVRIEQRGDVVGAGFDNPFAFGGIIPRQSFKIIATQAGTLRQVRKTSKINEIGQDRDYDLTLQAIGAVTVRVTDSFGTPVNGASVHVFNRHDYGKETFNGSTGADHEITFGDIREGLVTASVRNPLNGLKGAESGELTLDGQELVLDVTLQDTGFVRGRAFLSDGVTPAVAALVALKRGSKWHLGETDDFGLFSFEHVTLGSYSLVVQQANLGLGSIERFGNLSINGQIDDWGTLVLDDEDPFVESIQPETGARDLPLSTQVVVTFSEPMDVSRQGSSVKLRKISGSNVGFTSSWSADQTVLTMIPNSPLKSATGYEIYISQSIYDLAGRGQEWRVRSNFFTADVIPPAVIRTLPRHNDTQVPVDSDIRVTFSEPVDLASLSGTAFQLTDLTSGQGLTTTFQLRPGDREVILTPTTDFELDHDIQLTIQNVADTAGNVMSTPVSIVFWTPDVTAPTAELTAPEEGATFTAGDDIVAAVTATDNRGMGEVIFRIGDWQQVDSSDPYTKTLWAPVVDQAQSVTLIADVADRFGNTTFLNRDVWVEPHVNAVAPTVTPECWYDGDLIQPAVPVPVAFSIEDDERIESYALIVDGEIFKRVTPVNQASVETSIHWTPPHDALPGTIFEVKVEARDYAGNIGSYVANMQVPDAYRTSDQVLNELVDGQHLVLGTGDFTLDVPLNLQSLTLMRGARLITRVEKLDLTISGDLRLQCETEVNAGGDGYDGDVGGGVGGAPAWVTPATRDAGGSHGGRGMPESSGSAGEVYDSVYRPTLAGGGGPQNSTYYSADGGGIIHFDVAGAVLLNGDILARGANNWEIGGGAGGTVVIHATAMSGDHGIISTTGSTAKEGGPAGGGRVAIYVDDLSAIDIETQLFARGGHTDDQDLVASPGSVFIKDASSTYGHLRISNGVHSDGSKRLADVPAELPALGSGSVQGWTVQGADAWVTGPETFRPRWLGAWMTLLDGTGAELGIFEVIELANGQALLAAAGGVSGAASYRGLYRFDRFELINTELVMSDPVETPVFEVDGTVGYSNELMDADHVTIRSSGTVNGPLRGKDVTLAAGVELSPASGSTLEIDVTGTLTLEAGSLLDVTGDGYEDGRYNQEAGAPEGISGSFEDAGGSHGGHGQNQDTDGAVGDIYDSVYQPTLPGGGGGSTDTDGGDGGGVLRISAAEIVLDGTLKARGATAGTTGGSGAGGTVHLTAGSLRGSGSIDAGGGSTSVIGVAAGGTGGGGRVALWVDDLSQFDPTSQVSVRQGLNNGGDRSPYSAPGTLFVFDSESVYGDLLIDAKTKDTGSQWGSRPTVLPTLGSGSISAFEADGGDLWVTAADGPFPGWWHGVWMIALDAGDVALDAYRVLEIDTLGRARLEGAGALATATTFRGEYRFDAVTIGRGAGLVATDPVRVTGETMLSGPGPIELDADLITHRLTLEEGTILRPLSGPEMRLRVEDLLWVQAGTEIDLTAFGLAGGALGQPGEAPEAVAPAIGNVGGSHGGVGGVGTYDSGTAGEIYDSVYDPRLPGAGGGPSTVHTGRAGGGVLWIDAGSVQLDGILSAKGDRNTGRRGGGSGGTVRIHAGSMAGSGQIDVQGGDGSSSDPTKLGGPGGGGRIALYVDDLSAFDLSGLVMNGALRADGLPRAAPGTAFIFDAGSTYGDLRIDGAHSSTSAQTDLPSIGHGVVGTVTVDGANAWIEPADAEQSFSVGVVGMWLKVDGVDYPVVGERADRRGLLIEGGAGLQPAARFVGVYKFDAVTLESGAHLNMDDAIEAQSWSISTDSVLTQVDLVAPTITLGAPITAVSGELVTLAPTVTDDVTVASVTITFNGSSQTLTEPPYSVQHRMPIVNETTTYTWRVEALDGEGNFAEVQRDLTLNPSDDDTAPVASFGACPADGDWVDPGDVLTVPVTVSDELLERVVLKVDGVEMDSHLVDADHWTGELSFLVPDELNRTLVLTVEARDYGDNVMSQDRTVATPSISVLSGDQDLFSSVDGAPLILGQGTFTAQEALKPSALTLLKGAVLTSVAGQLLDIEVTDGTTVGDLTAQCGAAIDLRSKGYDGGYSGIPAGAPSGLAGSMANAGGSHAGKAWPGDLGGVPGAAYGSVYFPSLAGAGGAGLDAARPGGIGGGAVRLRAAVLTLDGNVLAGGETSDSVSDTSLQSAGAGAGGSVWLEATTLTGGGSIDASGGRYLASTGSVAGSAGGGRIAVHADDLSAFDRSRITAYGGYVIAGGGGIERLAGAGTILIRDAASTFGDLILAQAVASTGAIGETVLTPVGNGTLSQVEAITDSTDLWVSSSAGPFALGVEGAWLRIAGADYRIVARAADGRVRLESAAGSVGVSESYAGVYKFDSLSDDGRVDFEPQDTTEYGTAPVVAGPVVTGDLLEGSTLSVSADVATETLDPLDYSATIHWGDGQSAVGTISVQGPTLRVDGDHVYADQGTYGVSVCVSDSLGTQGCNSLPVTIANVAPVLELVGIGDTVYLNAGQNLDLVWRFLDPGVQDPHSASIDWGDGSSQNLPSVEPTAFESQSHVYGTAGTFGVSLCVDDGADQSCHSFNVEVSAAGGPAVTIDSVTAAPSAGQTVTLDASFTSAAGGPFTATLDWGDGSGAVSVPVTEQSGGGTVSGQHVYGAAGTFTATLCVNDGGGAGCASSPVTVSDDGPSVSAFEPFDYTDWHRSDVPIRTLGDASWSVNGTEVRQTNNSQPTFFVGEEPSVGRVIRGNISSTDDDEIGLVFGFSPGESTDPYGEYVVLSWKALGDWSGLRLARVQGRRPSLNTFIDNEALEVLSLATNLGTTPYVIGQSYEVVVETLPERLRIWIDGSLEIDHQGASLASLESGYFGFYSRAQQDAIFTDFGRDGWITEEGAALTVDLPISGSGAASGTITWGDGSSDDLQILEIDGRHIARGTHTYDQQGSYSGQACVDDGQGPVCADLAVSVWNAAPEPSLLLPFEAVDGASVNATIDFTDGGVLDTHTVTVDWGDGNVESPIPSSSGPGAGTVHVGHVYAGPGLYTVSACVTDSDGDARCADGPVTVTGGALVLGAPSVSTTEEGQSATLDAGLSGSTGAATAMVDWGDGELQTLDLGNAPTSLATERVYLDEGTYAVRLCVADAGGADCSSTTATVTNADPVLRSFLGPFDYSAWTYMDVPIGSGGNSDWRLTADGAEHVGSSRPTYFVGRVPSDNVRIRGKFRIPSDNDWIGFVFGYDLNEQTLPDADYLVLGWKRTQEDGANDGMRLARVQGITSGLWQLSSSSSSISAVFQAATLSNTRFDNGRTYELLYENVGGRFRLWIDGVMQFDLDEELPSGLFGFYAYSQPAEFWDFEVEALLAEEGMPATLRTDFTDTGLIDLHSGPGEIAQRFGGGVLTQNVLFNADGVRTASACVADQDGGQGCIEQPVTVYPATVDPAAPAPAPPAITGDFLEGSVVSLSTTFGSDDGDRSYTATVDWGDGTSSAATVSGSLPILWVDATHTYADDGAYALTVCVQDDLGLEGCNSAIPVVANVAPSAVLESTPPTSETYADYTFELSWSFTDPGVEDVFVGTIDWGDGTVQNVGALVAGQSLLHSHVYTVEGSYALSACVDDGVESGCVAAIVDVSVLALPVVAIDSLSAGVVEGGVVSLAASFTSDDVGPFPATVDWGDGLAESVTVNQVTGGGDLSVDHLYVDDGSFTVKVCVTDSLDLEGCAEQVVNIANGAPVLQTLGAFDYSDWHAADINRGSGGVSNWKLLSATQVKEEGDNQPSFFVGDAWSSGIRVRGKLWTTGDNDWMGLVFGFDEGEAGAAESDYLLLGWKDNGDSGVQHGLRLARITGTGGNVFYLEDATNMEILAEGATLGSSGYATGTNYEFLVESLPDQLRVWVDGVLQIDQKVGVDALATGLLGFYAYSQYDMRFKDFASEAVLGREGEITRITLNLEDPGALDTFTGTADWGDGNTGSASSRRIDGKLVLEAEHVYAEEGIYTANVCAIDNAGGQHCVDVPVEVWNADPAVSVNLPLQADGSSKVSGETLFADGEADTHTATVDWGDGNVEALTLQSLGAGAGRADLSHTYGAAGTYAIAVCVTDDEGAQGCGHHTVTVAGGGLSLGTPTAVDADEGSPVDLSASFTGAVGDVEAVVDWGDGGEPETYFLGSSATDLNVQHVYTDNGTFTIEVCVGNASQGDCATTTVTIGNVAPVIHGHLGPFDYSDWYSLDVQYKDNPIGNWVAMTGGMRLDGQSRPTFYVGDVPSDNVRISGKIKMFSDDDWVGLAFGLDLNEQNTPDPDFMVMGWKDVTQSGAERGLRLVRFKGEMIGTGLWTMDDAPGREVVALAATRGDTGYSNTATYDFTYEKVGDRIKIWVNDELQFDVQGDFPEGSFAFYGHAQIKVEFTDWQVEALLAEDGQASSVRATFTDAGDDDTHTAAPGVVTYERWLQGIGRVEHPVLLNGEGLWDVDVCVTDDDNDTACVTQQVTVVPGE